MPWAYKPSLATPRFGLAAATFDAPAPQSGSRIYAIGGGDLSGGNAILASVETYDTSTPKENWLPINPMHTARAGLAAASGSDGLHALGGINPFITGGILATHEIYDPATGQWSPALNMPTPREYLAAATGPDGLIYAIGGFNFDASGQAQYLDTVEAYDPATGAWISPAPMAMPTPRTALAAVTGLDGMIYAIGGQNSEGELSTVEAYDPSADQWHTLKESLPAANAGLAAAVDRQGLIYAIGGAQNTVYSYDPAHPTAPWTEQGALLTLQLLPGAATGPDGLIYAIGGIGTTPPPDPCAAIAGQITSFNPSDYQSPQAALAAFRSFLFAMIACRRQHGGPPPVPGTAVEAYTP
jgi:hypothetical protein